MKVYVVVETVGITVEGDTEVRGVWSTAEAAEAHKARLNAERQFRDQDVLEIEVDSEIESAWGP